MLLEVKDLNISLTSEKSVAEHISFRLGQGEMLSIVGSSGAGKTTICKAIMGLLGNAYRADGEILFQGEDLLDLPERKRQTIYGKEICLIMQNPMTAFNPSIRVGRQMEKTYLLHHGKTPRQEMQRLFAAILQKLGADSFEIRQKRDLAQPMDGLIIPGGESTVMGKLLKELDCYDEVRSRIENGLPVFGTCAGLILLAKEAEGVGRRPRYPRSSQCQCQCHCHLLT